MDSIQWFNENLDKWSRIGDKVVFNVPLEEIPEEVQKTAAAYEQTIVNSRRRMEIMHSMGVGVADWE